MLFEIKNINDNFQDMNLDYFNLNNKIDLDNGFYLGNIFVNTYKPYKNYKQKKMAAYSEQQKMLLKIYELEFIINDLNLYLDINNNDKYIYEIFKKKTIELEELKKKYYEKYEVLELCKDIYGKYTWINNPWPWDGGYYV